MKKNNKNKQKKKHCARQHPQSESERIKVDDFKASLIIITVYVLFVVIILIMLHIKCLIFYLTLKKIMLRRTFHCISFKSFCFSSS